MSAWKWRNPGSMHSFRTLNPNRIHRAFAAAGVDLRPGERFLNSLENRVVLGEDLEGRRWVGKFYRPGRWSPGQVAEEHRFLRQLAREGLPVAAPLRVDRALAGSVGRIAGLLFGIFPAVPGRIPDEINWELAEAAGQVLARIHRVGEREDFRRRPRLEPETWTLKPLRDLRREGAVEPDLLDRYLACAEELAARAAPLLARTESIRIHGDFHRANLLWGSCPYVVDFDDTLQGPPVHDLWMMAPGDDEEARGLRQAILEGYREVRDFDLESLRLVGLLQALRTARHAAWVAARRDDPAVRRYYPDASSREFWEEELIQLQRLAAALRDGAHDRPIR